MTGADDATRNFPMVVARWLLTQREMRLLLPGACASDGIFPVEPDADALRRISLLVALEAGLSGMLGRTRAAAWLRRPAPAFGGSTPLEAMAEEAVLVALARTVVGGGPAATLYIAPGAVSLRPARTPRAPRSP